MRAMSGVQLKDRNKYTDLMFMFDLNETINHLAMAKGINWYGHVLRRMDGHVMRRALDFEVEGQMKKRRLKRTWKKQAEEDSLKVDSRKEDAL